MIMELLKKYHQNKTGIFINGIGIGKIVKINHDYLEFEIVKQKETEKTLMRELTIIPFDKIETITEGEKEIPKSEQDKKIDEELGDL